MLDSKINARRIEKKYDFDFYSPTVDIVTDAKYRDEIKSIPLLSSVGRQIFSSFRMAHYVKQEEV